MDLVGFRQQNSKLFLFPFLCTYRETKPQDYNHISRRKRKLKLETETVQMSKKGDIKDHVYTSDKIRAWVANCQCTASETCDDNVASFSPFHQLENPAKIYTKQEIRTFWLVWSANLRFHKSWKEQKTWRQTEQESLLFLAVILIFGILSTKSPVNPFAPPVSKILESSSKVASTAPIWDQWEQRWLGSRKQREREERSQCITMYVPDFARRLTLLDRFAPARVYHL